jgi:hypothetical protein
MLQYLKDHRDSMTEVDANGYVWAQVYAMDITVRGIDPSQNAGYLSALEKAGLYRKIDDSFGMVRLPHVPGKTVS